MAGNEPTKQAVIELVFKGAACWQSGRSIVTNGKEKVHIRYCSPPTYKFNINPNKEPTTNCGYVETNTFGI